MGKLRFNNGQDGSISGIYAQRYDPNGNRTGSEFQVNSYTTDRQRDASVAMDDDGNFVIVWASYNQDGDQEGIYGQRYNASGIPQGTEFQVNSYTTNRQQSPDVAIDHEGDFVISWASRSQDGDRNGVFARRYRANGVPEGSEFLINTYTTYDQGRSSVAMDADGDFVIAWESTSQDGAFYGSAGIHAQRFGSPRILVSGGGQEIVDGDTSPTVIDATDFGVVKSGAALTQTFAISNTGIATLTVGPIILSGPHASDFSVSQPPSSPVTANGSTTFQITFAPTTTGLRSATVSFSNNDEDEHPCDFSIQGTGSGVVAPEILVSGNGQEIEDGDTSPTFEHYTDFGDVIANQDSMSRTFVISNTGNTDLTVGAVTLTGPHTSDFTVTQQPNTAITVNSQTTFQITFTPTDVGARIAIVNISNDDSDESPYNFLLQGTGQQQSVYLPLILKHQ